MKSTRMSSFSCGSLLAVWLIAFASQAVADGPAVSGVSNAADFSTTVAPGSLASLFGSGLASGVATAASVPVAATLNGVTVNVNGVPAPITYLSPTQINFQIPSATPVGGASVTVTYSGQTSSPITFNVAAASPGIFQYGANLGIVVNQDSSLNAPNKPAAVGSTVVAYLTGIGLTNPSVADGAASPGGPLAVPVANASASLGATPATLAFLGLSPGFVGLAQANIQVPNLPSGSYPLTITVNGQTSASVQMSVTGTVVLGGLPPGAKCVSGTIDYITFSLQSSASRLADEISIGGTRLCPSCDFKPPLYGNFVHKLEIARIDVLSADVCYDALGTLNYVRMRS